VNRYYSSASGRFLSPDPYKASAGVEDPGSWNRFAYVQGDPVGFYDPEGLQQEKEPTAVFRVTVTSVDYSYEIERLFLLWAALGFSRGAQVGAGGGSGEVGGGGSSGGSVVAAPEAEKALEDAFDRWKECAGLAGGISAAKSYAKSMTFLDGRGQGSMNAAGSSNKLTFEEYHSLWPSAMATTLKTSRGRASKTVVLWHDFFGNVTGGYPTVLIQQQNALVEEAFHSMFNLTRADHSDFINKFGIKVRGTETSAEAIQRWISNGCKE
jgi:uncharacterized protein RhaS with RHS repeats